MAKLLQAVWCVGLFAVLGVAACEAASQLVDVAQAVHGPLESPPARELAGTCAAEGGRGKGPVGGECVAVLREAVRLMGTRESTVAIDKSLRLIAGRPGGVLDGKALRRCQDALERMSDEELVGQFRRWVAADRGPAETRKRGGA